MAPTNKPHLPPKRTTPKTKGANPKAFTFTNTGKTEKAARRKIDIGQKKLHVPLVNRTPEGEGAPVVVAVVGPAKVK